jgi:hypothetical protein
MSFYLHHVPGRLRLQTPQLQASKEAARTVCTTLAKLAGVTEASVNPTTGSLLIRYDQAQLAPSALWDALCRCGLVTGDDLIGGGSRVTRITRSGPQAPATEFSGRIAAIVAEKLIERAAARLIRAFI